MTAAQMITVEDFVLMPDEVTDHYELVAGELVPMSSSTLRNSLIRDKLLFALRAWAAAPGRARPDTATAVCEMDVRTLAGTVRPPDISVFSAEQMRRLDVNAVPVPEPPMIAIEVLSPSEGMIAVGRKVAEYLRAGSREVWLVDHENREVHVRTSDGERLLRDGMTLKSEFLAGFAVELAELLGA